MKTCIIHIGMFKTGTTSIQKSLDGYIDDKFYYANLGQTNHSLAMKCLFGRDFKNYLLLKEKTNQEINIMRFNFKNKLLKSIKSANNRAIIISGEGISKMTEDEIIYMKNFFENHGYKKFCVFAYIRKPHEYINSIFQELLKGTFRHFNELYKCYPQYKLIFSKFFMIFDKHEIILRKFNPEKFPENDVVKDFCNLLGMKLPEDKIKRLNESCPREIVSLFYILRKFKVVKISRFEMNLFGEYLKDLFHDIELTKFKVDSSLINPIIEKNIDDIKWMEEKLGEPLIEDNLELAEGIKTEEELMFVKKDIIEKLIEASDYNIKKDIYSVEDIADMLLIIINKVLINKVLHKNDTGGETMQKAEIIKLLREKISEKYPQPVVKQAIPDLVNELFSIIKEELNKGEELKIQNFGTFKIREIKEEGEEVAKKVIRFIPSKQ